MVFSGERGIKLANRPDSLFVWRLSACLKACRPLIFALSVVYCSLFVVQRLASAAPASSSSGADKVNTLGDTLKDKRTDKLYYQQVLTKVTFHVQFSPTKAKRTFVFPKDYSLGQLAISPDARHVEEESVNRAARGTIVVPPGKFVSFIPAHRFYQNPAIIKTIAADAVDRLAIEAASLDDSEDELCDRALSYIGHLKGVVELKLDRSDASDKGVAYAKDLPNLQFISAFQCFFSGKCFKDLAGHQNLRCIHLGGCPIRDENLHFLCGLPHLEEVTLNHTSISDDGFKDMAACKELKNIDLNDNPKITDKSIKILLGFKKLRALSLARTSITNEAAMQLKQLPLEYLVLPHPVPQQKLWLKYCDVMPKTFLGGRAFPDKKVNGDDYMLYAPLH
jgi:hypothetical protein